AVACYRWSSDGDAAMFVPAVPAAQVRGPLIHEYGHHVDATRPHVAGARGLAGTPSRPRAPGIAVRLARGEVARDSSLALDRTIAECYAEDYAAVNGGGRSGIRWLGDPPPDVQAAVRADLPGAVAPPAPPAPAPPPPPQPAATGATAAPLAAATVVARRAG